MKKTATSAVDDRPSEGPPPLPADDNSPGAHLALLAANRHWRAAPWPAPYDATVHRLVRDDARRLWAVPDASVHLVVTSPPYFNLKPYATAAGGRQLGRIDDYEAFLGELDKVWAECARVLVPGGRVCVVVGDVLIPRRKAGRHLVLPLPADIQVRSRRAGLDNLTPVLWFKIGNRSNEGGGGGSGYYGKPYQPGSVIKNDHEHVLMLRKPGGYRAPSMAQKALSMLQKDEVDAWMRPIWHDLKGASLREGHPAPFPVEIAERLIRMFSFAGDTVLDPFGGSGSTAVAAVRTGRSSVTVEVEAEYSALAEARLRAEAARPRIVGAVSASVEIVVPPPMTARQIELGRHALGLPNGSGRSYRNRFVCGDGHLDYPDWMAMTDGGYADRRSDPTASPCVADTFTLTLDGAKAVLAEGEELDAEDFPEAGR